MATSQEKGPVSQEREYSYEEANNMLQFAFTAFGDTWKAVQADLACLSEGSDIEFFKKAAGTTIQQRIKNIQRAMQERDKLLVLSLLKVTDLPNHEYIQYNADTFNLERVSVPLQPVQEKPTGIKQRVIYHAKRVQSLFTLPSGVGEPLPVQEWCMYGKQTMLALHGRLAPFDQQRFTISDGN